MGVLRLFRWLLNNHKDFYLPINKAFRNAPKRRPEMFLVDCNAIFHPCFREIMTPKETRLLRSTKPQTEDEEVMVDRAIQLICLRIKEMINIVQPSGVVYLAVDGVAGCAKQTQQRKRRFKSAKERAELGDNGFDYTKLTAGTELMFRICEAMHIYFENNKSPYYQVIINGVDIVGEGEHKLIRAIQAQKKYKSFYIYSPDADLIMLSLLLNIQNVTIMRECIYDDIKADYLLVSIDKLRNRFIGKINDEISLAGSEIFVDKYIEQTQSESKTPPPQPTVGFDATNFDENSLVRDVILFLFIIGNDFLPNTPSVDVAYEGIEILFKIYARVVMMKGYLVKEDLQLSTEALKYMFLLLSENEPALLVWKYQHSRAKWPDTVLQNNINRDQGHPRLDFQQYRRDYYQRNFISHLSENEIKEVDLESLVESVCKAYLAGFVFVIKYYVTGIPTYDWYYQYHYAPLFYDLYQYCLNGKTTEFEFKFRPALSLTESLASVLPPSSFDLLPTKVAEYMKTRAIIEPEFPTTFEVDLEGKIQDYEAVLLLPMIDYDKVKRMLRQFKTKDKEGKLIVISRQPRL